MSWLSNRDAQNSAGYRYIRFVGGRILQDAELNALQDTEELRERYASNALFREGAVANIVPAIAGTAVNLAKEDSTSPLMLVFVNGSWEPVAAQTLNFPATKSSGTDTLYVHWVLWRVTSDGTYQGRTGCLSDPSLVDSQTNSPVGERGQLQLIFSFDQTLSDEPIDTDRMIAKSTGAIPVFQFIWTDSVPAWTASDNVNLFMLGSARKAGMVKLSTDTSSGVAAAANDPGLSDARSPVAGSVNTPALSDPEPVAGQTTAIGSPLVRTGPLNGGVDSRKIWFAGLQACLSDLLNWVYLQVGAILGTQSSHETRLTALEDKPEQKIDLTFHVGKPLGRAADGGFSHTPVVTDAGDGFRHVGQAQAPGAGVSAGQLPYAYAAYSQDGTLLGGISQNGDYVLANPNKRTTVNLMGGNYDLTVYSQLARYVAQLGFINGAGGAIEVGTDHLAMYGDIEGDTTGSRVAKIQDVPVDMHRSDSSSPVNGDTLVLQNGTVRFAAPGTGGGSVSSLDGDVSGSPSATAVQKLGGKTLNVSTLAAGQYLGYDGTQIKGMTAPSAPVLNTSSGTLSITSPNKPGSSLAYVVFTLGSLKIAFGSGLLPSGAVVPFPAGWVTGWTLAMASLSRAPRSFGAFEVQQPAQANGWVAAVRPYNAAPSDPDNWLLAVNVLSVCPVV